MAISVGEAERLTRLSAVEVAAQVRAGSLSAEQVLEAYLARVAEVNPQINAVVVSSADDARRAARQIDAARARGESLGPLAGVPMTIKDSFDVLGTPTTLGIGRRKNRLPTEDSPLVAKLRRAGAVVVGKTNVPQIMLSYETDNSAYGRTLHPERPDRGSGGSSGGEAAAVAARMSAVGLGSDLLGSIRQPAHVCGVHGFRPTTGRCTTRGGLNILGGMEAISAQPGPLARHVADVEAVMNVLTAGDDGDPYVAPAAWRDPDAVDVSRLRVGVWDDDPVFTPSPAIRRAVREAADALRRLGAEIVPLRPEESERGWRLCLALISAGGAAAARRMLDGEPPIPLVARTLRVWSMQSAPRAMVAAIFDQLGQTWRAKLTRICRQTTAAGYWELVRDRRDYVRQVTAQLDRERIDVVLAPPHGLPALLHGTSSDTLTAGVFAFIPNLLGLPCGTVAASRVRPGEESERPKVRELTAATARHVDHGSAGLPVGVQVAARLWREDVCLAVMRRLEAHFAAGVDYPLRSTRSG